MEFLQLDVGRRPRLREEALAPPLPGVVHKVPDLKGDDGGIERAFLSAHESHP